MFEKTQLTSVLKDPTLLREAAYIGGEWTASQSGEAFPVDDPATGAAIAAVANCAVPDFRAAIAAAKTAQVAWAQRTGKERAQILRRLFDLTLANHDDLAVLLTAETGKPLAEAKAEIAYGASYIEWLGEEAKRAYGDVIPGHRRDARLLVLKQPVGVVAAITAWNFPSAMVSRKFAPALAAGCAVVLKPAAETPLSALALAALAERAGLPAGLLNVTPTRTSRAFGEEACANPAVKKLSFTGSTEVGRQLMAQAAPKIMKLSLELGGNAPLIVFDDADLDAAVKGTMDCKFRNNGQTCVSANRLYV